MNLESNEIIIMNYYYLDNINLLYIFNEKANKTYLNENVFFLQAIYFKTKIIYTPLELRP